MRNPLKYFFRLLLFPPIILFHLLVFGVTLVPFTILSIISTVMFLCGEWVPKKKMIQAIIPFLYMKEAIVEWIVWGSIVDPFDMDEDF